MDLDDLLDSLKNKADDISNSFKTDYLDEQSKDNIKMLKEIEKKIRILLEEKGIRAYGYNSNSNNRGIFDYLFEDIKRTNTRIGKYIESSMEVVRSNEIENSEISLENLAERLEGSDIRYKDNDNINIDEEALKDSIFQVLSDMKNDFSSFAQHFLKTQGYSENTIEDIIRDYNTRLEDKQLDSLAIDITQKSAKAIDRMVVRIKELVASLLNELELNGNINLEEVSAEILRKADVLKGLKFEIYSLEEKTSQIYDNTTINNEKAFI